VASIPSSPFVFPPSDTEVCYLTVPGRNRDEAVQFLQSVGAGGGLGTGSALNIDLQRIRLDYESQIAALARGVQERQAQGWTAEAIAQWVSTGRTSIARTMRLRQGIGPTAVLEIRDNLQYGLGGRSFPNIWKRYAQPGMTTEEIAGKVIDGSLRSNTGISETALKSARYLRYGGRVVIVLSVGLSVYEIAHAKEADRPRVVYEQAGGFLGGYLLSSSAVAAVAVFGIVTGGWGLLAVGLLAGAAGGLAGSWAGDKIYYSTHPDLQHVADTTGLVPAHMIHPRMYMASPCVASCHSAIGFGSGSFDIFRGGGGTFGGGGASGGGGAGGSW
jgi:hypothetical protein